MKIFDGLSKPLNSLSQSKLTSTNLTVGIPPAPTASSVHLSTLSVNSFPISASWLSSICGPPTSMTGMIRNRSLT